MCALDILVLRIYLKFKFNWEGCVFICSVWQAREGYGGQADRRVPYHYRGCVLQERETDEIT